MEHNNPESPNLEDVMKSLVESEGRVNDKLRQLVKRNNDLEKGLEDVSDSRHEMEARIRVLESQDGRRLSEEIRALESRIKTFELAHDYRRENWKMVVNFVVQLLWVSMAAVLLTKLGLQAPL
jgi:chromosome segregation ATPase